jgi:hypothetical protein
MIVIRNLCYLNYLNYLYITLIICHYCNYSTLIENYYSNNDNNVNYYNNLFPPKPSYRDAINTGEILQKEACLKMVMQRAHGTSLGDAPPQTRPHNSTSKFIPCNWTIRVPTKSQTTFCIHCQSPSCHRRVRPKRIVQVVRNSP